MKKLRMYTEKTRKDGDCWGKWKAVTHYFCYSWNQAKKEFTERWMHILSEISDDDAQDEYDLLLEGCTKGEYIDTYHDGSATYTIKAVED